VERRREPRIEENRPVLLTVFGETDQLICATAIDLCGRGMKIAVEAPLPPNAAVKVEMGDALFLGEVCHCHRQGGGYVVGLDLEHALTGLRDLVRLNERLIDGWHPPASVPVPVAVLIEDECAAGRRR
jgi:hypothetical protein